MVQPSQSHDNNDSGRTAGIVHRRLQGIRGGDILEAEAYVYDRDGRRTFTIDETAAITSYTYDDAGRLSEVLYPRDDGVQASQQESLRRLGMTGAGQRLWRLLAHASGALTGAGQMPVRNTDLAGRLRTTSTERQAIDEALAATMPRRTGMVNYLQPMWGESYSYDSSGNRTEWRTPYQSVSYDYDEENRMTEAGNVRYEYGETGGVQREIGTVHELVYSYQDERVSGITGNLPGGEQVEVSYGYDALGRRASRRNGNDDHAIRTVYPGMSMDPVMTLETDRVFTEGITGTTRDTGSAGTGRYRRSDGPGAGLSRPASLETRTVRMGRDAVAQMTGGGDGEITYYGHDILGSVTARFSDRGQRVEELEYRAFGELRRGELTTEHPYGYTGKAMDPTTGIYDYGFRDYAPELARFTTVDPVRDGNNWYAYVGNDPVNFVDPLGLLATKPGDGNPNSPKSKVEDVIQRAQDAVQSASQWTQNVVQSATRWASETIRNPRAQGAAFGTFGVIMMAGSAYTAVLSYGGASPAVAGTFVTGAQLAGFGFAQAIRGKDVSPMQVFMPPTAGLKEMR